jgi:hypothetical protein
MSFADSVSWLWLKGSAADIFYLAIGMYDVFHIHTDIYKE